jgi:hypothetical protein
LRSSRRGASSMAGAPRLSSVFFKNVAAHFAQGSGEARHASRAEGLDAACASDRRIGAQRSRHCATGLAGRAWQAAAARSYCSSRSQRRRMRSVCCALRASWRKRPAANLSLAWKRTGMAP